MPRRRLVWETITVEVSIQMHEISITSTAPDERRRRRLALVLVLLLGLTGGVALGRGWLAPAAPSAEPPPAATSSTTPTPSLSPEPSTTASTPGPDACDHVKVKRFFAFRIEGELHHPELTTRHRSLDDGLTGCRWEHPGESISLIAGPAPIARPWAVIDDAWTTDAPWGCHADGGDRCTSVMWGAGTGATRIASWATSDGARQCVIETVGLELDQPQGDYDLWELCALLIGESSPT